MHPLHQILLKEIRTDISQMVEEGHDEDALLAELQAAEAGGSLDALAALQEDLWGRASPPGFPYDEPSDWEGISAHFPDGDSHARLAGGEEVLADRLLAGWRGRCAGCQLGKAPEGLWPEDVKTLLEAIGSWPLEDYLNAVDDRKYHDLVRGNELFKRLDPSRRLTKGTFDHAVPDDDIHYAIVSQMVLEEFGPDFTPEQAVGKLIELTPASCLFASGRNMFRTGVFGIRPPQTAVFGNPCRQSLGGQIRCDAWGWGAPGNPALAARMAYKDAASSQVRNGIYTAIFFAVLLADVLAHGDPSRAIDTAESYVPPKSRFAEMIAFVKGLCARHDDWQAVNAGIYDSYDRLYNSAERAPMNHSLPNAAIVVMALLKGGGDFTRTIGIAVMAGRDTDCNGATAGSIMGCALGTEGIPAHWTDPLNDTIRTQLKDLPQVRIGELAGRMYEAAKGNARYAR